VHGLKLHRITAESEEAVILSSFEVYRAWVPTCCGGVIIVETLFGVPGLGWTVIQAIQQQDLPIILGITILAATFVVVANLVVDLLYAVLDPRVRLY